MITMSDKWVYKYELFIPIAIFIFFVLHSPKTSNIYIIVIDDFTKILRVHNNDFLPSLIDYFFLFDIF